MNQNLKNLSFDHLSVLTVGDVMLDQYVYGKVDRISPEAPIPIFSKIETKSTLGGSGNVSKNIKSLGAESSLLALIGNDKNGVTIEKLCDESQITFHRIIDSKRPSTRKQRFISKSQQIMRIDEEETAVIDADVLLKSSSIFDKIFKSSSHNAVIIQDYNKGFLHPKLIQHIIAEANAMNIPTIVDPKFKNLEAYNGCTAIKPNHKELSKAINRKVTLDLDDLKSAVEALKKYVEFDKAYVTLGANGIYNYQNNTISSGYNVKITDITGAGDSVVSMLALLLAQNFAEDQICPILNIIGNLACRNQGAVGVKIEDLRAFDKS